MKIPIIKTGTRVRLNDGVAPATQGQEGLVIEHRWSSCDQQILNVVKMDDPDWGPKFSGGYKGPCETLGVSAACCDILGPDPKDALIEGEHLQAELRDKYRREERRRR